MIQTQRAPDSLHLLTEASFAERMPISYNAPPLKILIDLGENSAQCIPPQPANSRRIFGRGRGATTGNASAVRRLIPPQLHCPVFLIFFHRVPVKNIKISINTSVILTLNERCIIHEASHTTSTCQLSLGRLLRFDKPYNFFVWTPLSQASWEKLISGAAKYPLAVKR